MDLHALQKRAVDALMQHQVVASLMRGVVERDAYRCYLGDVYCYAQHSSQVIALAGTRLVPRHPPLAQYLFRHAEEELGHERWAAPDLVALGTGERELRSIRPSSPCMQMLALEYYYAAHDNPVGLFGWMFALESLGGIVGDRMAQALDRSLGLGREALNFLTRHAAADTHHSRDLARVIGEQVVEPSDREAFATMFSESLRLYCGILDHAGQGAAPWIVAMPGTATSLGAGSATAS